MNNKTKAELKKLTDAVEMLAVATMLTTGVQTTSEVCQACENLRQALDHDETIVEVS